jgi:hypothetical protein
MAQKKVYDKHIKAFFQALITRCGVEDTYSVIEEVQKMGMEYKQVQEWAEADEMWAIALKFCRDKCACNIESANAFGRLPAEKAFRYAFECHDEFIAMFPTPEAQEKVIQDLKKESSSYV